MGGGALVFLSSTEIRAAAGHVASDEVRRIGRVHPSTLFTCSTATPLMVSGGCWACCLLKSTTIFFNLLHVVLAQLTLPL